MSSEALDTFSRYQAYAVWHKTKSGQYVSYSYWLRIGKPEIGTKPTDTLPRPASSS